MQSGDDGIIYHNDLITEKKQKFSVKWQQDKKKKIFRQMTTGKKKKKNFSVKWQQDKKKPKKFRQMTTG